MLKSYFKIGFRNLMKYKFISFINLFGLSIGLTCCMLIFMYVKNEFSYDRFHRKADQIYRIERSFNDPESGMVNLELGAVAPPFAPLLLNDFKEIENLTRFIPNGSTPLRYEEKMFNQDDVYWADEKFFQVFDVRVTRGNPGNALNEPYSIMLSEEAAQKYFGKADPMNRMIRMNNQFDFRVTGVFEALPPNAHFHPEVMLSFNTLRDPAIYGEENLRTNFGNNSFYTYLQLPQGYDPERLESQFPAFLDRHINDGPVKASRYTSLQLRKLTDIHLRSHRDDEIEENGDIRRVYIFSAIALFILLIASINYMNLSTARSVLRAREIGIRKVVGAGKREIVGQFLSESVLICWLAAIMAVLLIWFALPWLNRVSGQELSVGMLLQRNVLILLLLFPFVVGLLSGIYPALFLSSFQPVRVLKGTLKVGGRSTSLRKVLVVTQFAISIILIICTAIVFKQLRYMQNKSLGFSREHIVVLNNNTGLGQNYEAFRTALLGDPNIKNAGRSSRIPSGRLLDASGSQISRGDSLAPTKADIKVVIIDEDFIPTYGIQVVDGRNFSRSFPADTLSFLINEAAVKVLGLSSGKDAVGKGFQYGPRRGQLIGVFKDFHFESLHQRILPMVFQKAVPSQNGGGTISIKISGNNIPAALAHIESTWKKFVPGIPFEYNFLDERFSDLYRAESRQQTIFSAFTGIAIFIACLGLLGLSAFTIAQRVREIGIRKVLGASVRDIVLTLSKDFMALVLVAAVIAFPVAWYAMNNWLDDFAYRISITWSVFILAGIIAAAVAFLTISVQAIRAAVANPIKSLRTE
ncbi:MAG TPA: ABC transporter permease [Sphingobacteriaceae bacterium]